MSPDAPSARAARAHRAATVLERFDVRAVLTLAILASLVPHRYESVTDAIFFGLFSAELALRVVALFAPADAPSRVRVARRRFRMATLLALDVLALLTFTPVASLFADAGWLRLFRLFRLLLLLGYWSPVFRQGLTVLSRQDRLGQMAVLGAVALLCAFAGAALLAHLPVDGVDFDGNGAVDAGDESFVARLWWSFRQIADNGNLVQDASTAGVLIVSFGLTIAGVLVVSFMIGLATDIVRELVEASRDRAPGWRGHTVVIHATPGLPRLVTELGAYYERLFRRPHFVVAGAGSEPPDGFRAPELTRVRWRDIDLRGTELAEKTDAAAARRFVVLAKPDALFPDAHLAAMVLNVREANTRAWVVAEVLDPANAGATRVAGGPRTVVIATEQLLAIWTLAAVRRPEQLRLARELVAARTGSELYTFFLDVDGLDCPGTAWQAGTMTFEELMALGVADRARPAVPLGVVRGGGTGSPLEVGELVLNPPRGAPLGGPTGAPVRAIVAIAEHFADVRGLATRALAGERAAVARDTVSAPELGPPRAPRVHRRVLVGGLRPATPALCAMLLDEEPEALLTLVQRHEESVAMARDALLAHAVTIGPEVMAEPRVAVGRFVSRTEPGAFGWVPAGAADDGRVRLRLVRADWSSERTLLGLEAGVDHVASYDLVILLGGHHPEYDGRTAMAALKIAGLARAEPSRFARDFELVAGIADAELGRRLAEGFERACGRRLVVVDTEELRAQLVFEAIAVPGYAAVFAALMGPGGQGFARLPLAAARAGVRWSGHALGLALRSRELVLVARELADGGRLELDPRVETDEAAITAVWVVSAA